MHYFDFSSCRKKLDFSLCKISKLFKMSLNWFFFSDMSNCWCFGWCLIWIFYDMTIKLKITFIIFQKTQIKLNILRLTFKLKITFFIFFKNQIKKLINQKLKNSPQNSYSTLFDLSINQSTSYTKKIYQYEIPYIRSHHQYHSHGVFMNCIELNHINGLGQ
jgi:hypothetical protein